LAKCKHATQLTYPHERRYQTDTVPTFDWMTLKVLLVLAVLIVL